MIERRITPYLKAVFKKYPVVTLTGPRQSGKTTLVRHVFNDRPYVNLEQLENREFARTDPQGFLRGLRDGAVIDEIQRVPALLSDIQALVDDRRRNGLFVLTGSAQFELMGGISQSLAGRTALLKLLPFSIAELGGQASFPGGIDEMMHKGFYPRIYDQDIEPARAYADYFETYVERDLRQIVAVKNISAFQKFVRLCAGRAGQLANLSGLGNDAGVSHTTAREWLSLLEASYIVFSLEPFHANIRKRLVRSPKIYFYDVGLAAFLLGIENRTHLEHHPLRGNLFENMVLMEFLKYRFSRGRGNNLGFYRDRSGHEVDLLYTIADRLMAVEIKSGQTVTADFFKGFPFIESALKNRILGKALVYGGERREKREGIDITDIYGIESLLDRLG